MNKHIKLREQMEQFAAADVVVAFSGGVDSSLLLKMACEAAEKTRKKVYAAVVHTMLHPAGELEAAKEAAAKMGAEPCALYIDELKEAGIENNPEDRCYRCKKYLFQKVRELASEKGTSVILEGTNEDDLHVYRPGIRAVRELKIYSPLADAGFSKEEVRALAGEYGLEASSKPSMPCLATRFPYGARLTYDKLHQADQGEIFLRNLGFKNVRIRVYGDLVRLEIDKEEMGGLIAQKEKIIEYLKKLGYSYITLDLEGFRSGSMDIHINQEKEGRK